MKNKVEKRFIATFFTLFMALSLIPAKIFAAEGIGKVELASVKYNYYAGDKPEATAQPSGESMGKYNIEYEYWEQMEINQEGESNPVKFWYSDEVKNSELAQDKRITAFEEGKSYMYSISLKATDGNAFNDNCEVYVNSEKVDAKNVLKNDSGLFVTAIKTIKPTSKEIDFVEIKNATLNFKDGDKPVFTGTKSDDRYKLIFEAWRTDDAGISSEEWFNNEDHLSYWGGKLITTFDKNKKYSYELELATSAEGSEAGWFFGPNTKLKVNGKEVEFTRSGDDKQSFSIKTKITMTPTSGSSSTPGSSEQLETVKEIESTGKIKAKIEFAEEVSANYELDVAPVEITEDLANKNIKYLVDINLLNNGQVVKISDVKMKIRIALPEDLKGFDKYEVVYISNDEIKETIPATIEDGYIVFETSHLSQYGVIATNSEEKAEPSETETDGEAENEIENKTNNPITGDNSNIFLCASLFAGSALAMLGIIIYSKKKKSTV